MLEEVSGGDGDRWGLRPGSGWREGVGEFDG